MEPGETDEDVANVTIEDVSDDIVRQRVDQALAREEAAAELIEVSFVHDAPDYTIELYNEGVHVCDLVAEGVFETRTQVGRCWSMRFAGQTLQEWEIAGARLLRLNAEVASTAAAASSGGPNAQLVARGRGVAQAVGWAEVSP